MEVKRKCRQQNWEKSERKVSGIFYLSIFLCIVSLWENLKCRYRKKAEEREKVGERGLVKRDRRGEEKCIRWTPALIPWCFARRRCIMFIEQGTVFFHCCARPTICAAFVKKSIKESQHLSHCQRLGLPLQTRHTHTHTDKCKLILSHK